MESAPPVAGNPLLECATDFLATSMTKKRELLLKVTSNMSATYGILIISFEGASHTLLVSFVRSQLCAVGKYMGPALFVAIIGSVGVAYFGLRGA